MNTFTMPNSHKYTKPKKMGNKKIRKSSTPEIVPLSLKQAS